MLSWSELEFLCQIIAVEAPDNISPSTNVLAAVARAARDRVRFNSSPVAEIAALLYEILHDESIDLGTMRGQLALLVTDELLNRSHLTIPDHRLIAFERLMDDIASDDLGPDEIARSLTDMVIKTSAP